MPSHTGFARKRTLALSAALLLAGPAFAADRVAAARKNVEPALLALFKEKGVAWPPPRLYLRIFKAEKEVEAWAGPEKGELTLIKRYPICAASGEPGPKRQEGDLQVPEGFYEVKSFNPTSNFHLSLEVSYPNASDRVLSDPKRPGGAIYVHGNCASIGCVAIEDGPIEEVYVMAMLAKGRPIPLHIFPRRLDATTAAALEGPHAEFWKQLVPGYQRFEATHRVPRPVIDRRTGAYTWSD